MASLRQLFVVRGCQYLCAALKMSCASCGIKRNEKTKQNGITFHRLQLQNFDMDKRVLEERLREATCLGDFDSAIKLLDNGVDVNSRSPLNGWTALHWACKNSNASMVSLLLSRGADSTIRTLTGQSPRDMTTSLEVATLLQACESPSVSPNSRSPTDRQCYDLPHNMMTLSRPENHSSQHTLTDIVLKVRTANSSDTDFIEIELPKLGVTYQNLLSVCCQELEFLPEQVNRIRKLPDTKIRSDSDVKRLKPYQELEIVLKDGTITGPFHTSSTNIYPSIAANRNQTVLY